MKKIILLVVVVFLLAGCSKQNTIVFGNVISYSGEILNISFNYPSDWRLNEDKSNKSVTITSPPTDDAGTNVVVDIFAETFDSYENANLSLIQLGKISVRETTVITRNKTYPAREYGQHGWLYYLIQVGDRYIGVGSERYWNQEQQEGVHMILDSISF